MKSNHKAGDTVEIFDYPTEKKKSQGFAVLIKKKDEDETREYWNVTFEDGQTFDRWISK